MGCIKWRGYSDDEDQYAVAVLKYYTVVGHIPRICSVFLARGGIITCMPMGGRRYVFFTPTAEYSCYNFWYKIFSNVRDIISCI